MTEKIFNAKINGLDIRVEYDDYNDNTNVFINNAKVAPSIASMILTSYDTNGWGIFTHGPNNVFIKDGIYLTVNFVHNLGLATLDICAFENLLNMRIKMLEEAFSKRIINFTHKSKDYSICVVGCVIETNCNMSLLEMSDEICGGTFEGFHRGIFASGKLVPSIFSKTVTFYRLDLEYTDDEIVEIIKYRAAQYEKAHADWVLWNCKPSREDS